MRRHFDLFPAIWLDYVPPGICFAEGDPPPPASAPAPAPAPAPQPAPAPAPAARDYDPPRGGRTLEQVERELADTRAEAAARRVDARTAREEADRAKEEAARVRTEADERVTAAQTAERQVTDRLRGRTINAELRAVAAEEGLVDLDLLPLVDRANISVDDEGNVTGVAEAVQAFKTAKPTYFRTLEQPPVPPRQTSTGPRAPAPPPAPGGPQPLPDVTTIPKTAEGRAEYAERMRLARRSLVGVR